MAGDKGGGYAERIISRARELRDSDAFAPARAEDLPTSAAWAKGEERADRRRSLHISLVFIAVAAAVAAFSLLLPYWGFDAMGVGKVVYSPSDVLDCYGLWYRLHVEALIDPTLANRAGAMLADFQETHPAGMYQLVMNRAAVTGIVVLCGVMLAVSGLLFQTAFRNPLAAPASLGVSDGVTLGCILYAFAGFDGIAQAPDLYLQLVYSLGALAVVVVLLLSRLFTGGARYNVLDMLLLGTVICQLLGGVNGYVQNFIMDYDAWYNFYDVQQAADALRSPLVRQAATAAFLITVIPALLLRFKLNLIAFDDDEGRMMGVRAGILRGCALVLGSAMQLAAIASIGQVAMLSLAVPFVVRYMMPADFRSQLLGNCLVGVTVLLACVCIQHFMVFGAVTMPVGTVVSLFIIPFFVWMVTFGRGRW